MEKGNVLIGLLILLGALVLIRSAVYTQKIFKLISTEGFRSRWRTLSRLMMFFIVGYVLAAAIVFAGMSEYLEILAGVIFLAGAVFVFLVVRVGHASFKRLQGINDELEKRGQELEVKNSEMEQFSYITSHDLQEPLRTVQSLVGLLQKEFANQLDENAELYLKFILESSNRMSDMIQSLLNFSRLGDDEHQLVTCDLNQSLTHVKDDLAALIQQKSAQIHYPQMPEVRGREIELRLLFQNLISNALKFSCPNVVPKVEIMVKSDNSHWFFAVKDNGIGIEEKNQKKIFMIFQRLHGRDKYEGTGIGLAFCKKIVDMHNGKIWVHSRPNEGSTFHFTLPR